MCCQNCRKFIRGVYPPYSGNSLREPEIDNSLFAATHFAPASIQSTQELDIRIFPNPAIDQLNIEAGLGHASINSVSVFDMTGKEVLAIGNLNAKNYHLNVSALSKGMYLMRLKIGEKIVQRKICIKP